MTDDTTKAHNILVTKLLKWLTAEPGERSLTMIADPDTGSIVISLSDISEFATEDEEPRTETKHVSIHSFNSKMGADQCLKLNIAALILQMHLPRTGEEDA